MAILDPLPSTSSAIVSMEAFGSLPAVLVAAGTVGALGLLNLAAARLGLVDHPDGGRKRHTRAVPLTGGFAILSGVGLGALASMSVGAAPLEILALLAIVAVVHAFDDQATGTQPGLSARQRLVIDGMVAFAFIVITGHAIESLGKVGGVALALGPLAVPFTILIYLALTNAYNMIDGLDGLALSQFLIAFVGLGIWRYVETGAPGLPWPMLSIALASAIVLAANLGLMGRFLRCFLGDSGARLLGFFLVYLLVAHGGRLFAPSATLYFVALPLFDLCAVFAERWSAGHSPMRADRRHLHHLLVDAGFNPHLTVVVMGAVSAGFIGLGAWMQLAGLGDAAIALGFVALAALYLATRRRVVRGLGRALAPRPMIGPAE